MKQIRAPTLFAIRSRCSDDRGEDAFEFSHTLFRYMLLIVYIWFHYFVDLFEPEESI